ncbi:MAG TPA: DUF3574 domain-containing protein [Rhizomicrobium sp.]|nr:DUF3574 domain-containing protein [Rhizomicrobium sp.]
MNQGFDGCGQVRCILAGASLLAILMVEPGLAAERCPLPGQKDMLLVKLYFGQSLPGGHTVQPRDWARFLSTAVTPRFPDGFTVYDTYGQWMDAKKPKPSHERSKVVEIAAPDSLAVRTAITDIARRYREIFHQQSVGIVTSSSCAAF